MKFEDHFIPDDYFAEVNRIKPDYFVNHNIKWVICDIDNTLATYSEPVPIKKVKNWLDSVESAGTRIALMSNNSERRVCMFNSVLGYPYVSRAGKPGTKKLKKLMEFLKVKPEETAILGDQIFTDVYCAKKTGARAVMVRSIDVTGRPFLKFKKHFEQYFMEKYYLKNNK